MIEMKITGETAAVDNIAASKKVDIDSVAFNAEFCAQSDEPFYTSGTWKKREDVSQDAYDIWHGEESEKARNKVFRAAPLATAFPISHRVNDRIVPVSTQPNQRGK